MHLPRMRFSFTAHKMALSPVYSERDELIQAIDTEAQRHDDQWQLEATPDADSLEQFWRSVDID